MLTDESVSKNDGACISGVQQLKKNSGSSSWPAGPWRRKHGDTSKMSWTTTWYSVTSQETWNLSNIAVRTSNITSLSMYHNHCNWKWGSERNQHILYSMCLPVWTWCLAGTRQRRFDRTLWPWATVPYPITVNSNLVGEDQLTNT